jgi:hypothetical protein
VTGIKICGIASLEDALMAADCGADALGFIFHRASPRYVTPEKVRDIVAHLPPFDWYQHVGKLKFIDSNGIVHDNTIRGEISSFFNSPDRIRRGLAHLVPDNIVDHVPILYATHIWNNIP